MNDVHYSSNHTYSKENRRTSHAARHQLTTSPFYSHVDTHTLRAQPTRTAFMQLSRLDTNA